jgi:gliding motility-associated-like protein
MRNFYCRVCIAFLLLVAGTISFVKAQTPTQVNFSTLVTQNGCGIAEYKFDVTLLRDAMNNDLTYSNYFYYWDFGNATNSGSPANSTFFQNVVRNYTAPGNYTVRLEIYGSALAVPGNTPLLTLSKQITVFTTPAPDFFADVVDVCLGDPVTFTDPVDYTTQAFVGPVLSRRWNMGNGNFFDVVNPATNTFSYTYPTVGDYQVTLTTRTSGGRPGEECTANRVRPMYIRVRHKPTASFTINTVPPACSLPYAPTLTNNSTIASAPPPAGVITSYTWRFYDGPNDTFAELPFSPITTTSATAPVLPANAYNAAGTYAITLQATSSTGCNSSPLSTQIFTINPPQTADFILPIATQVCQGGTINFINSSTSGATSFLWSFSGATPSTSTAPNPFVTYATSGTYNTTLQVTYPDGCVRTVTKPYTITVIPQPNANFTNSPTDGFCNVPKDVTFTPLQPQNPNYTYNWNFGENIGPGLTGPVVIGYSPTNRYEQFGTYNVTLTVTDNVNNCSSVVTRVLTLVEPILSITPRMPTMGCLPLAVVFDLTGTAIEPIVRYSLDYDGDGTPELTVNSPPTPLSIPATSTFTYNNRGTFIPTFEIETLSGCVKRVTSPVPIRVGAPPIITGVQQTGGGSGGCQGGGYTYTPLFQPGFEADEVSVSFDGGTPIILTPPTFASSHLFTQNGTRNVTYTALFNGCPIGVPFSQGVNIQSPIANLSIIGTANLCTAAAMNQVCVNIGGSIDSPTGTTDYTVDFGDGVSITNPANPNNVCHTYINPGTYMVTLTAVGGGCTATTTRTVTISPTAVADFTVSPQPTIACSANQVTFQSTSTSSAPGVSISRYIWNFGDGSPVANLPAPAGANITHIYPPSGTSYTPSLTIELSNGCSYTYSGTVQTITSQGPIPTIQVLPTLAGCTGEALTFNGSATVFPAGNSIPAGGWEWNFGDPGSIGNVVNSQNATHTFVNPGTYTVRLRVRDDNSLLSSFSPDPPSNGCVAERTVQVQIFAKPTVSFTAPPIACVGQPVAFTSTTNATTPAIYEWDFDGNLATIESTQPNPTYTFTTPATPGNSVNQVVTLTVTSSSGCKQTFSRTINVINPNFDITATANGVTVTAPTNLTLNCPPKTANFSAIPIPSSLDLTGWTFNWQFGDGNQANALNASNEYNSPNAPAIFTIVFTATNTATGCSITKTLNNFITVTGPKGVFDFFPKFLCKPDNVTFTAGSFTGNPVRIRVDYGNGFSDEQALTVGQTTATFNHTYTQSGSFLPIMTLEDASGCRIAYSSNTGRVNVSGNPIANFTWTGGGQICQDVLVNFSDLSTRDLGTPTINPLDPQVNRWAWTIFPEGGMPIGAPIFTSTLQNPSYTFTAPGDYAVRLTVRTAFNQGNTPDGCPSTIDKVIRIVAPSVSANIVSILPANRCPNEAVTFTGSGTTTVTPNNLTYHWRFFASQGGNINGDTTALVGFQNGIVSTFAFATPGTYVAKLVVRDVALCTGGAIATSYVIVDPIPTFVSGPTDQSICVNQTASFTVTPSASALSGMGVNYQWQVNDGGGWTDITSGTTPSGATYGGFDSAPTLTISNVTNTALSNYQYRAIITKNNTTACRATSNSAVLTVNQTPTIAVVPALVELCNFMGAYTLNGNTPMFGTGLWTKVGGPAGGAIMNANNPNATISGLQFGTYTYRWTITNGTCAASSADFTITNAQPANAGTDQNLCESVSFNLIANNPQLTGSGVGAIGTWSIVNNPSGATIAFAPDANTPNVTVTGATPNANPYIFRWTITGAVGCATTQDDVQILNNPLPTVTPPSNQTICAGQNTTFAVGGPPAFVYQWQVGDASANNFVDLTNNVTYANVTSTTLTINNASIGINNTTYRVRVTNPTTGCFSFSNSAILAVLPLADEVLSVSPMGAICTGTNITFSLSNTLTNYTYQLREGTTPVAGIPVITGSGMAQSFTAFSPTATATYNVLRTSPIVNGFRCEQQLSTTVGVTVNQGASPSAAGPNIAVCATSANLNANLPAVGTGTWVVIQGGSMTSVTDPSNRFSTVNNLQLGDNIFEWRITSGICPPTSSQMTITRTPGGNTATVGGNQFVCATTATLNGNTPVNGGTGTWTTTSPTAIINGVNNPNATVDNLAVGANLFTWTIVDACGTTSANVTITREELVTLSSAGPTQNICGTATSTTLAANTPVSGGGRWFNVPGFGSGSFVTDTNPNTVVNGLSTGLNRFEWRITNSCNSSSSFVDINVTPAPTGANAGPDQTLCANTTALSASVPTTGTGRWEIVSSPVGGLPVINDSNNRNSLISNLQIGTTVLRWIVSNGGAGVCAEISDEVNITSNSNSVFAYAGPNVIQCGATVTLQANAPAVGTNYYWTLAPGTMLVTGTLGVPGGANGTPTITVTNLAQGSNVFSWTVGYVGAGCSSAISNVDITRTDNITTANAGANQTICQTAGATTLNANIPNVGTGAWSVVSVPVGANIGDVNFINGALNNTQVNGLNVVGSYVLRWTITNGTCSSNFSNVQITVVAPPTPSNAGMPFTICANSTPLAAMPVALGFGQGTWSVVSVPSGASVTFDNVNSPTAIADGLSVGGNYIFKWTTNNGTACGNSESTVTVTRTTLPTISNAGSTATICATSYVLNGNTPAFGQGTWSVVAPMGAMVTFSNVNSPTATASGLTVSGAYTFTWTIANAPCASSVSSVVINVNTPPTAATVGATQDICGAMTTLTGNNPVIGTGRWEVIAGGATIDFPSQFNSTVSGLTAGVNRFRWVITNGNCSPSSADLLVNSFAPPSTANAGANALTCDMAGNGFLNAVTPTVGTGTWRLVTGAGTILSPNNPTTQVSGLGFGANVFEWRVDNGVCPSASNTSQVTLTRRGAVSLSVAGTSQTICGSIFNLNANTPNIALGETGAWSVIGGATLSSITDSQALATNLAIGFNVFTWTVTNGCATSVSSIIITRNDNVTPANAGTDQTICATSTSLNGNTPTAGNGQWSIISTPAGFAGGISFGSTSTGNTTVSGLTLAGNYTFRWTISNGMVCTPSTDDVVITVLMPPSASIAGLNQTICSTTATLSATAPAIGTGEWSVVNGTGSIVSRFSTNSQVINLSVGINVFRWTITNGTCPPSTSDVIIVREATPTTANAGTDQSTCNADFTLSANTATVGTGDWSVSLGSATITNRFSPNTTVTGLSAGLNTFTWTITNGSCPPSVSNVNVTRLSPPTTALVGANQVTCLTTANLTGNVAAIGTGEWTVTAGGATVTDRFNPTSGVTGLTVGINTFRWTVSNACGSTSATLTITRDVAPTTALVGTNQVTCNTFINALSGNVATSGAGLWTVTAGTATVTDVNNPNSGVTGLGLGINTFRWTISNTCSSNFAEVSITRETPPTVATVGTNQTVCATTATLTGNTALVGTGSWTVTAGGATVTDRFNPTSGVTGLTVGVNTFTWTISNSCATSAASVSITRNDLPTAANAGTNQTICANSTTLSGNNPTVGNGLWSVTATPVGFGGTIAFGSPVSGNTSVSGLTQAGTYTFAWTISNGVCPASQAIVNVTVAPLAANAGANQALCNVNTATLAGNSIPLGATGTWSQVSGAVANITNTNLPNTTVTGLTNGTYVFRWTLAGTGCGTSTSDVTITISSPANAGPDQSICGVTMTTLAATPTLTGTGTWSVISGPSTPIFNPNINSPTATVTGLLGGTYILQWEVTGGACPTTNDQVTIAISSPASAGTNISACAVTSVPLNATPPTTGTGAWSQISGTSTANFSGNVANATASNLQTGIYIFRWTITGSACTPSTSDVTVLISENANAGADQNVCNATTATLAGNVAVTGTGTWTQVGGNAATITSPNSPNTTITGLTTGSYTFQWTLSGGICGASNDQVVINVSPTVSAGANQALCGAVTTTLNATAPVAGIGAWTQISGPNIALIGNPGNNSTNVSNLRAGTYIFRWTITGTPCPNLFSDVTIINGEIPNAGSNQTICFGNNLILNAQAVTVGTGQWSQVAGPNNATFVSNTAPNSGVSNLTVGTYIFRWTVTGTTCAQNTSDVTINVVGITTANTGAIVSDTDYCDNQILPSIPITVSTSQNGVRYELRNVSGSIVAFQTGTGNGLTFNISPAPTVTTIYNVFAIPSNPSGTNCNAVQLQDQAVVTVRVCERQSIGLAKTVLPLSVQSDGSINVTYLLTVRNLGNTELTNIQVTDDLTTVFPAPARYTIVSPPSATGVLLPNLAYTGSALNPNLLTGLGRLSANETQTISFVVNVIPSATSGTYTNTAVARGERGNVVVTDRSTDGVNVDPDNDNDPRENTPTVFSLPPNLARPRIGVAKNLFSVVRQSNGSFNVTYQMTVRNYGNVALSAIQVVDDLSATFPSPVQFSIVGMPTATGNLTINNSYTGTSGNTILVNGGSLAINESQSISLTVNLIPNSATGTFRNTAIASGANGGTNVTDNSQDGVNPDINGDNDPREESPTIFSIPTDNNNRPLIGVAKALTNVIRQNDGTYNVTYAISVRNYGNVELTNIQVADDLNATFPSPAQFRITSAPTTTGNLTANPTFTGTGTNTNLVNGGRLAVGETQTVSFTVNLTPNIANTSYRNTTIGSGEGAGRTTTDVSTDGLNPDLNGDGTPNENIPTVFSIPADRPRIGVAKNLLSAVRQANGSFNLTYLISVRNYGNVALSNIQVTDNLSNTFPSPAQFSVINLPMGTGNLIGNSGFLGTGNNINLLSSGTLGIGERQAISFTVNLIPNGVNTPFNNTAIGRGEGGGATTTDTSSDGLNPDNDNDGDPREESPTIFSLPFNNNRPSVGIAKSLIAGIRQPNGSFNLTYRLTVRNLGNIDLTNIQVTENLSNTFPAPARFSLVSPPTVTGNLSINPNFTGTANNIELLTGSDRLGFRETQFITFTVNLIPDVGRTRYNNFVTVRGNANGSLFTHTSTDGIEPDSDGDGLGDTESPTVFVLPAEANRPTATRFSFTTDNCASTILTEKIILQDIGLVRITNLPNTVTPLRGVVSINADGQMIYKPALNAVGLDSLEYEICNSINQCAKGKIFINVLRCTSQPPIIRPDEFGTDNCTELTGNVLPNDADPNGTAIKAKPVANQLSISGGVYSIAIDGTFSYLPPKGFVGRDSVEYEACNSTSPLSKCGKAKIYVDVLDCEDIFIPEGFSPNGDGVNDRFVIKGAERYQIKFQVYNRWGNLVYEGNRYFNDWEGNANVGVLIGEGLPDGTYYYIVDLQNNTKPRVGFLTLHR